MCHRKSNTQAKKGFAILICLLISVSQLAAQNKIIFINSTQGKLIRAKEGDMLSLKYKGYLGQTETFKNTLSFIGDSSFTIGIPMMSANGILGNNIEKQFQYKEIRYQDILAFRRSSVGRTLLKSSLSLGAAIGSFLLLNSMYERNNVSDFGKIGISIGIGLTLNMVINLSLPDKPNHKMEEGWEIKVIKE
jgi:hypothetical protein